MKRATLFLLTLLSSISFYSVAQETEVQQDIFLFSDYTDARVLMKNKSVVRARLNYDSYSQEMTYVENGVDMILDGLDNIDTIYIADRKFIPLGDVFHEVIPTSLGPLSVNWKTQINNIGKKGAMGQVTHGGTIAKMDVKRMQGLGYDSTGNEVYRLSPDNSYAIRINDKVKKFKTANNLVKLFPKDREKEIRSILSREKIDMQKPSDVAKLINSIDSRE